MPPSQNHSASFPSAQPCRSLTSGLFHTLLQLPMYLSALLVGCEVSVSLCRIFLTSGVWCFCHPASTCLGRSSLLLQNLKHHRAASPLHKTDPFLFAIPTHRQACLAFLSSEFGQRQLDQRRCLAPPAQTRLPTPPLGRTCARPPWFLLLTRVPLVFCTQRPRRVCRCCCACAGAWRHQCCLPPSRRFMPRLLV